MESQQEAVLQPGRWARG